MNNKKEIKISAVRIKLHTVHNEVNTLYVCSAYVVGCPYLCGCELHGVLQNT
jgi:hypothetical protein